MFHQNLVALLAHNKQTIVIIHTRQFQATSCNLVYIKMVSNFQTFYCHVSKNEIPVQTFMIPMFVERMPETALLSLHFTHDTSELPIMSSYIVGERCQFSEEKTAPATITTHER